MKMMRIVSCPFFLLYSYSFLIILVTAGFNRSSHYLSQSLNHVGDCNALLRFSNSFSILSRDSFHNYYCDHYIGISSYPKTASWKNGTDCCSWDGVTCQASTHTVIGLDLSCSLLIGTIDSNNTLFSLPNLRRLNLAGNYFNDSPILPEFFRAFPAMTHLNLSDAGFSGILHVSTISQYMSGLISLDLSMIFYRRITIEDDGVSRLISNMTQLAELVLDGVDMAAVSPVSLTNLSSSLKTLSLSGCGLQGTFPNNIFRLPNLHSISLFYNVNLDGTLPQTNWTAPLVSLDVSFTSFSGSLPESLGNLTSMKNLVLSYAQFNGPIPQTLGKLTSLTHLDLYGNRFSGTFDFEMMFAPLKALEYLWLGRGTGNFTMLVPSDGNCSFPRLKELGLLNCLLSTTGFPYFLNHSTELEGLGLSGNGIGGPIPEWLWRNKLTYLSLGDNNLVGEISSSICQLSFLYSLNLSNNGLSGTIPTCLGNLSSLQYLDLGRNGLRGPIPIPSRTLYYYVMGDNKFEGDIPRQICDAYKLGIIDMSKNSLTGSIPHCFKNMTASLYVLDLSENNLVGQIPDIFVPNSWLEVIRLRQNKLQGSLPRSLSYCKSLKILDVGDNSLNGSFPNWLETLQYLQVLVLRSNRFHSEVVSANKTDHPFKYLRIFDISGNKFYGQLSVNYIANLTAMKNEEKGDSRYMVGNVTGYYSISVVMKGMMTELVNIFKLFTTIDFSCNFFEGEIPKVVGELKALIGLNLSHNNLTGTIPSSIRGLTNLEWLDLSSNCLTGEIPMTLGDLSFLGWLNLSMNQLVGPIPRGTQMDTFRSNSFRGNAGLCGRPLPKTCGTDSHQSPTPTTYDVEEVAESEHWIEWKAVLMGLGCGVILGISIFYIVEETGKSWWLKKMVEGQLNIIINKVKLFLSEDAPFQVSFGAQDHLKAKTSGPLSHLVGPNSNDALPPGFEAPQLSSNNQIKLSEIPLIRWRCPRRFALNDFWSLVAGKESCEVETESQREMRVLEAVYPRESSIPQNPAYAIESEKYSQPDHQIPSIPITAIEDEEMPADQSSSYGGAMSSQAPVVASGIAGSYRFPDVISRPDMPCSVEPDVVDADSAALSALMKSNEHGSDMDPNLLLQLLRNPEMIGTLGMNMRFPSEPATSPIVASPTPQPVTRPVYSGGEFYSTTNGPNTLFPQATSPAPPQTTVRTPPPRDMNYYKNLIHQHGASGERQEFINHQYSNYRPEPGCSNNSYNGMRPKGRIMKPCIYFNSSRGCKNGVNCAFQHDSSVQPQANDTRDMPSQKRMKFDSETGA